MEPLLLTPSLHATLPPPRRSLKWPNVTARERSTTSRSPSRNQTRERRARLEDAVAGSDLVFSVRRLAADGVDAWKQVVERGYEGYVAKDQLSPYRGGVTRSWLKVKVPGWTAPEDKFKRVGSTRPDDGSAIAESSHIVETVPLI
jgi:hypothetical protein